MNINIIAAISKNRVIGNKGQIPWNIKKDLKYFQKLTTQKIETLEQMQLLDSTLTRVQ